MITERQLDVWLADASDGNTKWNARRIFSLISEVRRLREAVKAVEFEVEGVSEPIEKHRLLDALKGHNEKD